MFNTHHCLRPDFTKKLFDFLKEGRSINLVSKKGRGRKRLLLDLQNMAQEATIATIFIDMNAYKQNYQGFLENVQAQVQRLGIAAAPNAPLLPAPSDISIVLEQYLLAQQPLWILLHRFDALLDNKKQNFPKGFFDDLNSLKNRANIQLCCTGEKAHNQQLVYYKDEKGVLYDQLSWLELTILDLPPLHSGEIRQELRRTLGALPLWQTETQQERFVEAIKEHIAPLHFIERLKIDFEINNKILDADQRLKLVYKDYKKHYNSLPQKKWNWDWILSKLKELSEIYKNAKS